MTDPNYRTYPELYGIMLDIGGDGFYFEIKLVEVHWEESVYDAINAYLAIGTKEDLEAIICNIIIEIREQIIPENWQDDKDKLDYLKKLGIDE